MLCIVWLKCLLHNSSRHSSLNVFVGWVLLATAIYMYIEQLADEYNCIHDLSHQLYLALPLQLMSWVKYKNLLIGMLLH